MLVGSAIILWLATIVMALIWLCRPSDLGENRYGGLNGTRSTEATESEIKTDRSDSSDEPTRRTGYSRRREH